ncbi:MAG: FAD-dependent oxidoreductase [Pelagimonas sp.]|jgi:glycine oxidase|nr:FAD-dependent oxidoreductase [Pelagimonas sp.]
MSQTIRIAGAGLAGLATAHELLKRGCEVVLYDLADGPGQGSVARYAGGMLAPFCEGESAEDEVVQLGQKAADWWAQITRVTKRGTLVLAPPRDRAELSRFARMTQGHRSVDADALAALEPELAGRFAKGLFYDSEAHLDPRRALRDLCATVEQAGGVIHWNSPAPDGAEIVTTGMAAPLPGLRPVRGEMAILHCPDVTLTRTIRLLHPRMPLYLVPRGDGHYMIGATMIESSSDRPASLRSLTEMFSAAFTLHPGFAEAAVLETGTGLRPAFDTNLPRITRHGHALHLNGFYRHGFLLVPAMAARLADQFLKETRDETACERATA